LTSHGQDGYGYGGSLNAPVDLLSFAGGDRDPAAQRNRSRYGGKHHFEIGNSRHLERYWGPGADSGKDLPEKRHSPRSGSITHISGTNTVSNQSAAGFGHFDGVRDAADGRPLLCSPCYRFGSGRFPACDSQRWRSSPRRLP